jgi:hypothetical protein
MPSPRSSASRSGEPPICSSPQIEHVEDIHLVITHLLTVLLRGEEIP